MKGALTKRQFWRIFWPHEPCYAGGEMARHQEMFLPVAVSAGDKLSAKNQREGEQRKTRRCRGIKDDGKVCKTVLSSYNPDPNLCAACQRRFNCRGETPHLAPLTSPVT